MATSKKLVLICIDASEHSMRAFDWYFSTSHMEGSEVGLAHVHCVPHFPIGFGMHSGEIIASDMYQHEVQKSIQESKAVISKFKHKCEEFGITPLVFAETQDDSIGYTLCKIAKAHSATMIVMGQRGLGTVRRTLFGSVSDYILHHVDIPCIVVPPKQE